MKRAVVVGGSGFIGSHVSDCLSEQGYRVTVFDRQVSNWLSQKQVMLIGDISELEKLNDACSDADVVYNFAAMADLDETSSQPLDTAVTNVVGNINVLEACRINSVKRYVYASTVYVYSREGGFYRCSKQAAENYIEEYQRRFGINYTILRYGSLYGPRSDYHNGLWRVVKHALERGVIRYDGSPESMREYIHVQDAAQASVAALDDQFCNQHLVITGQEQMRVHDLLKMLAEILGKSHAVEFVDTGEHEGHYVRTPYTYQPKIGRKYVMPLHVDLGQGLLQLIAQVEAEMHAHQIC
jgi:UDP-glucose 4-epimerase